MSRPRSLADSLRRADGHGGGIGFRERLRALAPILVAALFFAVVAALGAGHVTLRLRELEVGRQLVDAHDARSALQRERKNLETELGTLTGTEHVLSPAREKLRLLSPLPTQLGAPPP